jgi:hypothetical protein
MLYIVKRIHYNSHLSHVKFHDSPKKQTTHHLTMNKLRSLTKNEPPRLFIVHVNSSVKIELFLQNKEPIGFLFGAIEHKLNVTIDDKKYQLYTSDNAQVNLNALAKQVKQNEFWIKPEYDLLKENANKVFGLELTSITERHPTSRLPNVLHKCFEFLDKERSLRTIGLFRLCGNRSEVEKYKKLFESPAAKDIDFPSSIDPNIVAGVVKVYFRDLPEPLLLSNNFQTVVDIGEMINETDRLKRLKDLIHSLPIPHYEVLKYVIEYVLTLIMYSAKNKITSNNMAIVFGPLWIRKAKEQQLDAKKDAREENQSKRRGLSQRIKNIYIHTIGSMIENYSFLFEGSVVQHGSSSSTQHPHQVPAIVETDAPQQQDKTSKLRELLTNLAQQRNEATTSSESSSKQSAFSIRPSDQQQQQQQQQESQVPKFDKSQFFAKLKEANHGMPTKTPRNVGTYRQPETTPTLTTLLPTLTNPSPRSNSVINTTNPSPRQQALEQQQQRMSMNMSGDTSTWSKIIYDLEEKLTQERELNEKLKQEKDSVSREALDRRKELNKELDDYHEKHRMLKTEYDRAKNKWKDTEEEFKERITKLENEIRQLKKENLELKIASSPVNQIMVNRSQLIQQQQRQEEEHLRKKSTGTVQVSDKFKRASVRLNREYSADSDSDSGLETDDDEDDNTDKSVSTTPTTPTTTNKRLSVRSNQPNLFEDKKQSTTATPNSPSSSTAAAKKKEEYIETCSMCKKGITSGDEYVQAKGNTYHTACFKCFSCQSAISGAFAEKNSKFYCKGCLEKMKSGNTSGTDSPSKPMGENTCGRCMIDIPKNEKVRALSKSFHKHCFKCFKCNSEFENNKFFALDGNPVCINCKRDSMKPK